MTSAHPLSDRRARSRTGTHTAPTYRACVANACRQGHKACPTPQACEVPSMQDERLHSDPQQRKRLAAKVIALQLIGLVCFLAIVAANA